MNSCFDSKQYIKLTQKLLSKTVEQVFGKLYVEVEGKLLKDDFASRVLPGYEADNKKKLITHFKSEAAILVCINADAIINNQLFTRKGIPCVQYLELSLKRIETATGIKPQLVITNINMEEMYDIIFSIESKFQKKGYRVWEHYQQRGFLSNKRLLSELWLGGNDHIPLEKKIIFVTGIGEEAWAFRTCMSQLYLDHEIGIESSFCMLQTFPIPELWKDHPLHQARNARKKDRILIQQEDGKTIEDSTLTNFKFLKSVLGKYLPHTNLIHNYSKPSEMLIAPILDAVTDIHLVEQAAHKELESLSTRSSY